MHSEVLRQDREMSWWLGQNNSEGVVQAGGGGMRVKSIGAFDFLS